MSKGNENIAAIDSDTKTERRWNRATRALMGLTVFACMLIVPATAQISVMAQITASLMSIGNFLKEINTAEQSVQQLITTVVAPAAQIISMEKWLTQVVSSYEGYFNSLCRIPISSATLSNTSALENALRIGYSGGTGSGVALNFTSVYGARLTTPQASAQMASRVDMYDTTAQEAMALAANSDNASTQLISTAQGLQAIAATTAPGTAGMVEAEAQALQLHSNSMIHHVIASMLRQEAAQLAAETAKVKDAAINHTNIMTIFGGQQ